MIMNRREIWSNIKRELLGLKWVGNTTRQLSSPPPPTPTKKGVGRGLFGVCLQIVYFNFQFSKSIKSSTFHIFPYSTYPLRKKYLFPKMPKTRPTICAKCKMPNEKMKKGERFSVAWNVTEILAERPCYVKTTFASTPALNPKNIWISGWVCHEEKNHLQSFYGF